MTAPALGGHHKGEASAAPGDDGAGQTCGRCGAELLLAGLSPAKPALRFRLRAGVSHPPAQELGRPKVFSDLQTYKLRGRQAQLLLNNHFPRQQLMPPDQFVVMDNKS